MRPGGAWHRIRWGNLARLGALVALALLVAAWPRLGGPPPRLPPAEPVPVAGAQPAPVARPPTAEAEGPRAKPPRVERRRAKSRREGVAPRREPAKRRAAAGAKRAHTQGPSPAKRPRGPERFGPRRIAPSGDPAGAEFGLP
jgi:hypothetical protein